MTIDHNDHEMEELEAELDIIAALPLAQLSISELVELLDALDATVEFAHDMQLKLIGRLHRSSLPIAFGGTPLSTTLSAKLGISKEEARKRIDEALKLGYG